MILVMSEAYDRYIFQLGRQTRSNELTTAPMSLDIIGPSFFFSTKTLFSEELKISADIGH